MRKYKFHIDQLLLFGSYLKGSDKLLFDKYAVRLPSEDAFTKASWIVENNKHFIHALIKIDKKTNVNKARMHEIQHLRKRAIAQIEELMLQKKIIEKKLILNSKMIEKMNKQFIDTLIKIDKKTYVNKARRHEIQHLRKRAIAQNEELIFQKKIIEKKLILNRKMIENLLRQYDEASKLISSETMLSLPPERPLDSPQRQVLRPLIRRIDSGRFSAP